MGNYTKLEIRIYYWNFLLSDPTSIARNHIILERLLSGKTIEFGAIRHSPFSGGPWEKMAGGAILGFQVGWDRVRSGVSRFSPHDRYP